MKTKLKLRAQTIDTSAHYDDGDGNTRIISFNPDTNTAVAMIEYHIFNGKDLISKAKLTQDELVEIMEGRAKPC